MPARLGDLVEQARTAFLGGGERHGIALDLPAGLPPVMADPRRIVQVLNHLFANAARHAPETSSIRVSAVRGEAHVAVALTDEGRGLAPELLPCLFSKHGGAGEGGTAASHGLGLAICEGLVEAHGGRIRGESPGPGLGTTVTFALPAAGAHGAMTTSDPPAAPRPGEPVRILAVDDDPHMLRLVRDTLEAAGYAPLVTGEPEELAALVRAERPRLVLLDLVLPGPDGIELMWQTPELSDLPVIFISAHGRDETVARALEAGAADYIVKPFSPTELIARVRAALRRHEAPEPFVLGALAIDYDRRHVTVAGEPVPLAATEYELLRVLSLDAGRVVTYDTLLRRVWHGRNHTPSNPVRASIRSLHRKLGDDAAKPEWVFNDIAAPAPPHRDGEDEISQVPGRPLALHAPLSDPGEPPNPGHYRTSDVVFRPVNNVDFALGAFQALSRGLHALCVRFAAGVAPEPRNTRFRLVANLGRAELSPAGSHRRSPSCLSLYMASSFTKLCLAQ